MVFRVWFGCRDGEFGVEGSAVRVWGFDFKVAVPCCANRFDAADLLEPIAFENT